ncbi:protein-L-isoaspartate(D-aspartate) O-methyltransferase [Streptomyces sp. NPDC002851]
MTELDWRPRAEALADKVTADAPVWREAVADTPRHALVPRWWTADRETGGWDLHDGATDPSAWLDAAYSDVTLVTRVGPLHADHATPGQSGTGEPTSSSTLPGLIVTMLRHLDVPDGAHVVDVATGSGYSAGLLAHRLGDDAVLSVDVDPYLTTVAARRLDGIGRHPRIETTDATGPLPVTGYDRLMSTVSARGVPASWLAALRPGGRLVTTIAFTSLMVVAEVRSDDSAEGGVMSDHGHFMAVRHDEDYASRLPEGYQRARDGEGDTVTTGKRPIPDWWQDWQLSTVYELTSPGVQVRTQIGEDGERLLWLLHRDGSWARASASHGSALPTVHQAGPRRLWDELERAEARWNEAGRFDPRDLRARLTPEDSVLGTPDGA